MADHGTPAAAGDDAAFRAEVRGMLTAALRTVAAGFAAPWSPHDPAFRRAFEDRLCGAGWSALSWPAALGGRELPLRRQAIYFEEYARCGAPQPLNLIGHGIVAPTLILHGTPEQQARFLPPLRLNHEIWCQGYSEPGAGSDLAALATRARRDGDRYVVRGQKVWTSFAQFADWCFLLARTDPDVPKHRGISVLIVDMKSPGVTVRPIHQISGEDEFNEVFLDDVAVPVAHRIGAENDGWRIAMAAASFERATYFIPRIVRMEGELADLVALARTPRPDDAVPADDPLIADRLARCHGDVRAIRLHADRMLEEAAGGGAPGPQGSFIKLAWSEAHQRLLDLAMDVLGPAAALGPQVGPGGGRWWRRDQLWSRAETILAGTSEIQRNIIAERVLGLPR